MGLISTTVLAATFNGFGGVIILFLLLASYVNVLLAPAIYKQVEKTNIFRNVFK